MLRRQIACTFIGCVLAGPVSAADALPDFSGLWARNSLYFEPPDSGPGPVTRIRRPNVPGDAGRVFGDYTSPILKPDAAELVKKRGEITISGLTFPTPHDQCLIEATPYVVAVQFEMQILQQKDKITLIYLAGQPVRHVRLNSQHPARVTPSWSGDSIGRYEGDTLVIDTVGIKAGPLSMVDWLGTPHSSALHVIERYRLIDGDAARRIVEIREKDTGQVPPALAYGVSADPNYKGKGLQVQFTVDDPRVFTTPWTAQATYLRALGEFTEVICSENALPSYWGKETVIPTVDKPDF